MKTFFNNLAGGINQSASKTELGLDNKKLFWADSENIELLQNAGIIRQNGNTLLFQLSVSEEIIGLHQLKEGKALSLLLATNSGKLFVYEAQSHTLTQLTKTVAGTAKVNFVDFLDGVIVGSEKDALFYINNDVGYAVESCNLHDSKNVAIISGTICVYKGRVWVGDGATIYYSALGKYNDFSTANDAGYINNFYTDTNDITALKTYKDYLAIYKENSVFLLSGSNPTDFEIVPFADKGTTSMGGVVTVNNKQYFINQGVFSMEQAGLLSQIQLGDEITLKIKPEFDNFDNTRFDEIIILHYESKNQVWCFIPYKNDAYFHTIWIYSYINDAWFKRVVPQNVTRACVFDNYILTADNSGKVYREDFGNTFNGSVIKFMWKSPFLSAGDPSVRKNIEEFYFIIDETYDNNFNFSVYKNYDSEFKEDADIIYSTNSENLIWYGDNLPAGMNFSWNLDDTDNDGMDESIYSVWSTGSDSFYKAEISDLNYTIQICLEGSSLGQNMAVIGLEFKEVYLED